MEKEQGLTIVELLITISILVAATTTVLVLGDRAISQIGLFSAYSQATFLAKEGMELLEDSEIRDDIWIEDGQNYWNIDYEGSVEKRNDESDCQRKLIKNGNGLYINNNGSGEESIFSRCIKTTKENNTIEAEVMILFNYRSIDNKVNIYRLFYD